MIAAVRRLWAAPRSPGAPARVWRDWWLVGILLALVGGRGAHPSPSRGCRCAVPMALVAIGALLFRRTHPLAVGPGGLRGGPRRRHRRLLPGRRLGRAVHDGRDPRPVLRAVPLGERPGGRARHGASSWRRAPSGSSGTSARPATRSGEAIFFLFPCVLGGAVRAPGRREAPRDRTRSSCASASMLARELHDTVAHHVSAIAIRAQAGRVVGGVRPVRGDRRPRGDRGARPPARSARCA